VGVARDRAQPIEVRKQALFWAGQGGAPIADLTSLYTAFDDREMKDQLIFVYSQREEPAAVDKLLDIARRDPDSELRKKALFWLGQSDDPRAAKALQDIIEQP
jgi:HEAT repeat protein